MKHPVEEFLDPDEVAKRLEARKNREKNVKLKIGEEFSYKMNTTNRYIEELLNRDDSPKKVIGSFLIRNKKAV